MPRMPIQDEPESTIGRKPAQLHGEEPGTRGVARSGAALRRAPGDEPEAGSELRERERHEPPSTAGRAGPGFEE